MRCRGAAILAQQEASEAELINTFDVTNMCTLYDKRVTIKRQTLTDLLLGRLDK